MGSRSHWLLIITPTACCFSTHSLFMFHVFCEFIPIRGPCAPHYALKLNKDIKYLCSKQYLQFDPYSCLTITDRLLGFGGTLILKSSLLPSNLFCQLGAIVTSVCQGTDFQATLHMTCVSASLSASLCVALGVAALYSMIESVYPPRVFWGSKSFNTDYEGHHTQYTQRSGSNIHILTFLCTHRQHAHSSNFR